MGRERTGFAVIGNAIDNNGFATGHADPILGKWLLALSATHPINPANSDKTMTAQK